MAVAYLSPDDVDAARIQDVARNAWGYPRYGVNADGYGRKIPTQYMVRLKGDHRWRRVYVACFSNAGTAYIVTKAEPFLCISRAEYRIKSLCGEETR